MTNILLATAVVLSTSLSTGAAVDLVDASEIEASATELANSRSEDISVVDLSYSRRTFSVDIELHETVLREPSCTYLITELDYQTLGAGVSPFSVARVADVRFTPIGEGWLSATLYVEGPAPADIEDVVAVVGCTPTPHP